MRALLVLLLLAACTSEPQGAGVATRDSASVRIVETDGPLETWRLGDARVEIPASAPGAPPPGQATAGTALADGSIVLRAGPAIVRFYDPDGSSVRTLDGSVGDPPAFRSITGIERLRGDTVAIYDSGTNQVSIVRPGGLRVRVIEMPAIGRGVPPHRPHPLPDGSWIGSTRFGPEPIATFEPQALLRDSALVYRFHPATLAIDTLVRTAHDEIFVRVEGNTRGTVPRPFGRASVIGVSDGRVVVGNGDAPEVRVFAPTGDLLRIYRWSAGSRPVTDADMNAYEQAVRAALASSPQDLRERMVARVLAAPRPDTHAPYATLLVDADDNLWLGEPPLFGQPPRAWNVIAPDGRWLARVELPAGVRILDIGSDFILAHWRSGDDPEVVRVHELVKPGA